MQRPAAAAPPAGGEGSLVKIAGMVVWVLTAGIGIYLLAAGMASQRQAAGQAGRAAGGSTGLAPVGGGAREAAGERTGRAPGGGPDPLAPGTDGAAVVGPAALAGITAPEGAAAPGGAPGAEGSPLLEFIHPLLALLGLTFWIFFVMTDGRLFAWIAFGLVVATVLAGLSWALLTGPAGRRAVRRAGREPAAAAGPGFPARLVTVHGLAAACTLALVVISAAAAARG